MTTTDIELTGQPQELPGAPEYTQPSPRVAGIGLLARLQLAEPVRLWLYPVVMALVALAVTYGLISDTVAPQWEALAAAVLAVGGHGVVRAVRGAVVSPRTHIRELVAVGGPAALSVDDPR